ncbi:MAG: RNase adapter RapZ [Fusobacteria bacterium]|nr:RNase adapter RapZ [Fusobacteriota bacterium]
MMEKKNTSLRLLIISGLSGAGKSQVMNFLEDSGYFCIDNFPPYLVTSLIDKLETDEKINKVALAIDIRGGYLLSSYKKAVKELEAAGKNFETIFIDAANRSIISRYKMSRRRHPLIEEAGGDMLQAIRLERDLLLDVRDKVDRIIDTTDISSKQLALIIDSIVKEQDRADFLITISSFGYKYGLPIDADLVMDVRFLPNPFYIEDLKPLTGEDKEVEDYVMNNSLTQEFLSRYVSWLKFLIPHYMDEGKRQLVIAIGCTGGQHRSVAISRALNEALQGDGIRTYVYHRELWRY